MFVEDRFGYRRADITVTTSGQPVTSDPLIVDVIYNALSVHVCAPTNGTGYMEYTLSSVAEVEAGTACWAIWPAGTVQGDNNGHTLVVDTIIGAVTAVRVVTTSGDIELAVVAR